ncbi:aspartate aminotransferase family protein [Paraburkholderia phymatum]|uniref:Aspartate aminotransferase family protein n=1 Tax=Paraburkholderia phymatum TaxID=148447 RepID=A0ACC6U8A7_9BURK
MLSSLQKLRERYVNGNPKSAEQFAAAAHYLPGANTRAALHFDPFPLVMRAARGSSLTDLDGHTYIDFSNDLTAAFYGHSHPLIVQSIHDSLSTGIGYGAPSIHEARLASAICTRWPSIERVRFCNSGTEANLLAVQLARYFTQRQKILAFIGGYHGSVMNFLPNSHAPNTDLNDVILVHFNDATTVLEAINHAPREIAAIIVEPMMGSAGGIRAEIHFLEKLKQYAIDIGALLIFDEVQTGRLAFGGLQERLQIIPDITTLGKFVGGGFAFGAFGGRKDVLECMNPSRNAFIVHGGTFNNAVLTAAAGFVGLNHIATRQEIERVNELGERLRADLQSNANDLQVPLHVGGIGSLLSLHFQKQPPKNISCITTPAAWRKVLHLEMLARGFYLPQRGTFSLSLATTEEECAALSDTLLEVFEGYRNHLREFAD